MAREAIQIPVLRVFISYAWTAQEWAKTLAERLMTHGIDVKMDIYDLKPGQDRFYFMESIMLDASITKVLILCDQEYTRKANSRTGGVGHEAQILTPEIYEAVEQNRLIPIIRERDEKGKEYTPLYLQTRIYIDLSNPETYEENYEQLVRDIYNKPRHIKPELGKAPSYVTNDIGPQPFNAQDFKRELTNKKCPSCSHKGNLIPYTDMGLFDGLPLGIRLELLYAGAKGVISAVDEDDSVKPSEKVVSSELIFCRNCRDVSVQCVKCSYIAKYRGEPRCLKCSYILDVEWMKGSDAHSDGTSPHDNYST